MSHSETRASDASEPTEKRFGALDGSVYEAPSPSAASDAMSSAGVSQATRTSDAAKTGEPPHTSSPKPKVTSPVEAIFQAR